MAENKTTVTDVDPEDFLASVKTARQREESRRLLAMMSELTGAPARMWGPTMVGFGQYHYRYDTGREGDALILGFAPRSGKFALYGLMDSPEAPALLERLGTHRRGAGCLYVNRLDDVDEEVLAELIRAAWAARRP
ncbi:DUF1801 domain-containing protein [Acidipropionibacterium jensenii]|uniref:DUF1801 domain-containing protein n=1 Tax=Acidipropionibacterium jensenii TaxID=1749 RepID=UPI002647E3EB|nr:DUF1801 domain-containing protein [Acidipropionibacterium jensenii]MDN5977539.1 DUF1801 domain-containing protein [Acidipropionibacterium jensenii]MDN5996087.1 DUF1801 domain-containing protein [Acidipropionibacterium jensenii]MDN6426400.1 DUF1801 domain-containing protein [Acidipropionibacterium jensenii]MDN6441090.1 DUF1801 domain-containing protein [Acidipropionibacterium jensenii]MDN6480034.1 DUF1801 domain-containing protein [Acidipropionibacterium jensenii]